MMARIGIKWGTALVSLMLLGGCLQQDPAGPDPENGKDLNFRGADTTGGDTGAVKDTCGIIIPRDSGTVCTMEYEPVCGEDGKTYGNRCVALVAKVEIAKAGVCGEIIVDPIKPIDPGEGWACPAVWDPVCGKDGKTYGNSCEARLVGVASPGQCILAP